MLENIESYTLDLTDAIIVRNNDTIITIIDIFINNFYYFLNIFGYNVLFYEKTVPTEYKTTITIIIPVQDNNVYKYSTNSDDDVLN